MSEIIHQLLEYIKIQNEARETNEVVECIKKKIEAKKELIKKLLKDKKELNLTVESILNLPSENFNLEKHDIASCLHRTIFTDRSSDSTCDKYILNRQIKKSKSSVSCSTNTDTDTDNASLSE